MDAEDFLGDLHAKSYEREIDENESIWRSLPLFTVAFGFAATLLNYLASFIRLELRLWPLLTLILLLLPTFAFGWAFRWFWDVIRIRTYRYVAPDTEIRRYASEMRGYYELIGGSKKEVEQELVGSIKTFYYKELAASASQNQKNNQARAKARSLVAFWLTAGFALAFLGTAIILGHEKLYGTDILGHEKLYGTEPTANAGSINSASPVGPARSALQPVMPRSSAAAVHPRRSGESVPKG